MKASINLDSAFDRTILSLCNEIDMLNHEVEFWKKKYENEYYENVKTLGAVADLEPETVNLALT